MKNNLANFCPLCSELKKLLIDRREKVSPFCGRRFRTFNVVDDYNREALAIEVDLSLPSVRVIRVLERIVAWRGYPVKVRKVEVTIIAMGRS